MDQLTRMMALELGPEGIRTNAVNPTVVLTALGKAAWSDPAKAGPMLSRIPIGRFAETKDVVDPVLFLYSNFDIFFAPFATCVSALTPPHTRRVAYFT